MQPLSILKHTHHLEKKISFLKALFIFYYLTIPCGLLDLSFPSVQSLSSVQLFATPWTAARQASLSITKSRSSPKPISIKSVTPSNHLILFHPFCLLPAIFPSIRVFSNESTLHIWRPKYWRFSTSLSNAYSGLIPLGLTGLISSLSKGLSRVFSSTTIRKHQFFSAQPSSHSRWNLSSPTRDQTPAP